MANEKRLIDANALKEQIANEIHTYWNNATGGYYLAEDVIPDIDDAPTVDAVEVVHGQRLYNAHEVAEILAEAFGDPCACNFNGNDEWLPYKCELQSACPNPAGVACWEQYLKYRYEKMGGGNEDG